MADIVDELWDVIIANTDGYLNGPLGRARDEIKRLQRVEAGQLCFMCSERIDRQKEEKQDD